MSTYFKDSFVLNSFHFKLAWNSKILEKNHHSAANWILIEVACLLFLVKLAFRYTPRYAIRVLSSVWRNGPWHDQTTCFLLKIKNIQFYLPSILIVKYQYMFDTVYFRIIVQRKNRTQKIFRAWLLVQDMLLHVNREWYFFNLPYVMLVYLCVVCNYSVEQFCLIKWGELSWNKFNYVLWRFLFNFILICALMKIICLLHWIVEILAGVVHME